MPRCTLRSKNDNSMRDSDNIFETVSYLVSLQTKRQIRYNHDNQ